MKKMPKSCELDGMMMLLMIQIFEKHIHFIPIFIQNFQILYAKDRQIGTVFFSKHGFVKLLELLKLLVKLLKLLVELPEVLELFAKLLEILELFTKLSELLELLEEKIQGVLLAKCCSSLDGYRNSLLHDSDWVQLTS